IVFLFGAVIAFTALIGSASARAQAKFWISKHFFSYKYDYREEWLQFIETIASEERQSSLQQRIVRATAAIVDCSAGALWVLRAEDKAYLPSANWNMGERLPAEPSNSPFISALNRSHRVIDLDSTKTTSKEFGDIEIPTWIKENNRAWLVTPIVDRGNLSAFLILGNPRVRRDLTWEDFDLLKTVGQQAASYLAEEKAMNELTDARRLESFNQRFAFVVHDIKNLVSQMSLLLQNAKKHGDNPEFQKDMLATVGNSVTQLNQLLTRFKADGGEGDEDKRKIADILASIARTWTQQKPDLEVSFQGAPPDFYVNEEKLESILNHLLQNAIEAIDINGKVSFRQTMDDNALMLEIEDNGPGMSADYIQDHLFRPLDTQKSDGYGLGAYQTRELVRQLGGRLEVESTVGEGTIMRILLPRDDKHSGMTPDTQRPGKHRPGKHRIDAE
ncbi:MAG: PEP-CTERM system histidine kinase PrsK, partial [Alphaproteobacteria bacterium]|nr:PEP-CTERM system histidine kinase PrsK [Alphaproteobacteria bacterium]